MFSKIRERIEKKTEKKIGEKRNRPFLESRKTKTKWKMYTEIDRPALSSTLLH